MQEIVCAHRWGFMNHVLVGENQFVELQICDWCRHTWRHDNPEPRTVIARIE